mmetsp:Transcript_12562/g.29734  ORF Transcript_12562/g.29734 Transcript_12562/m.29734 type:complete len:94 (-) Transcript_12562:1467-1748(-)
MTIFNRLANLGQKGAVAGLFSVFAWQIYQIGFQCTDHSKNKRLEPRNQHTEIMEVLAQKVEEESQPHAVGSIPDRYEADDDSYLQRVPKLNQR